jgi:hypothetical protein
LVAKWSVRAVLIVNDDEVQLVMSWYTEYVPAMCLCPGDIICNDAYGLSWSMLVANSKIDPTSTEAIHRNCTIEGVLCHNSRILHVITNKGSIKTLKKCGRKKLRTFVMNNTNVESNNCHVQ